MCGIAGITGKQAADHAEPLRRMVAAMEHRGPDDEGIYIAPSGNCILGHRRLSILDLSDAAAQPMATSDKHHALVYNGECYNFQELKASLEKRSIRVHSSGDTEVVFRCVMEHGPAALPAMNAMFGLAYWNDRAQTLLLARDRYGQKPVYYYNKNGMLLFASEVRALLASGLVPRSADMDAVKSYLSYGSVMEPSTIVAGVSLLAPACCLEYRPPGSTTETDYWSHTDVTPASTNDEIEDQFHKAVSRHLVSDAPLGLFLSGGIDSSAVAASAAQDAGGLIKTLCVVFPDQPDQSEARYAKQMAEHAGTEHTEIPVTGSDILQMIPKAVAAMDQPTGDAVNTYLVSYAAHQAGLKVALSGLGGDELFGGYHTFHDIPRMLSLREKMGFLGTPLGALFDRCGRFSIKTGKLADMFGAPPGLLNSYLIRRRVFTSRQINSLAPGLCPDKKWDCGISAVLLNLLARETVGKELPDAIGILEMRTYMGQTLLRDSDCMGMAHNLEIRLPFLDTAFSGYVLSLPSQVRTPGHLPKWRFIEAMQRCLPKEIYDRPKQGFMLPFKEWMLNELREEIEPGLEALCRLGKVFDEKTIMGLWRSFCKSPAAVGWFRIWSLYILGKYITHHKLSV